MKEVLTNEFKVSKEDLFARTSQCVAVGFINSKKNIGAIVHLHVNSNYTELLDNCISQLLRLDKENWEIVISGGVNLFIPEKGLIQGEEILKNVKKYLKKRYLDGFIINEDTKEDFIRILELFPKLGSFDIKRI